MQPLQWVRSFEATARHGNFTRAAQELGLTQAAISQHVKALEERLGVQLFERRARGVALTGAGSELYTSVAEGIGRIEAALGRFGRVSKDDRLHVLSNSSMASSWLTHRLHHFLAEYPGIDLRISTALWQTDAIGVKADISLFLGPLKQAGAAPIPGGDLVTVCGTGDVEEDRLIHVTGFEAAFEAFRKSRREKVRKRLRVVECDSFQAALLLAQAGMGRTFAPRLLAAGPIREGALHDLGPCDFHPPTSYWARIDNPHSKNARNFKNWITATAADWVS